MDVLLRRELGPVYRLTVTDLQQEPDYEYRLSFGGKEPFTDLVLSAPFTDLMVPFTDLVSVPFPLMQEFPIVYMYQKIPPRHDGRSFVPIGASHS